MGLGILAAFFYGIYFFGSFFFNFGTNLCYSGAIRDITDLSVDVSNSDNINQKQIYSALVEKLPLYGYETNCEELQKAVTELEIKVNNAKN